MRDGKLVIFALASAIILVLTVSPSGSDAAAVLNSSPVSAGAGLKNTMNQDDSIKTVSVVFYFFLVKRPRPLSESTCLMCVLFANSYFAEKEKLFIFHHSKAFR